MKPPTIQEVIEYCRRWFLVDPQVFFDYYEANEWHDKDDSPVKRWKGKVVTWHNREKKYLEERGTKLVCRLVGCEKDGTHLIIDDTGQKSFWCNDHKPKPKPLPADHIANTIKFKEVPKHETDVNAERNRQRKGLGL